MASSLDIVGYQMNPRLGDIAGNVRKILQAQSDNRDIDLIVTPEMSITGYPIEDLAGRGAFIQAAEDAIQAIQHHIRNHGGPAVIVGAPARTGDGISNAAFFIDETRIIRVDKHQLPNYGVFDEKRQFVPGRLSEPVFFKGWRLGILICEDVWHPEGAAHLKAQGADMLIAINGSPFEDGKQEVRKRVVLERFSETGLPILYLNMVGGQDEIVFDGASFAVDWQSASFDVLPVRCFQEMSAHFRLKNKDGKQILSTGEFQEYPERIGAIYSALVLGLRDYVEKNGFPGVLLGVSGGIDSALTAAIAVDALGPDNVMGLMLPYCHTSDDSLLQARELAGNLEIDYRTVHIGQGVQAALSDIFEQAGIKIDGIALENLQARERGQILMTLSNQTGKMLLTTGNKSENAVGYATLYGDMCGGFNVLKDVFKTDVYALARWRNEHRLPHFKGPEGLCIPEETISRPPSAELAPDQKDSDSLPPYEVLDDLLAGMIDGSLSDRAFVLHRGYDRDLVAKVRKLLDRAEYKRRQAAPGVKISGSLFGRDRRVPITNLFQETP